MASRLVMDDYVLASKAGVGSRVAGLPVEPFSLFTFTTGSVPRNRALMDEGVLLPWWTEPHHLNAFFRPLSAFTHQVDFALWPRSSALMHLHSMLWFGALLLALGHAYRRLEPHAPLLVGFALLLYAIDDAHGATVGWVANRNAIVSAALALPALSAHHFAISQRSRIAMITAPLWLALGLCAGETAFCIAAYLVAYALCLDRRALPIRLLSLWPYLAVLLAHRALYHALGLGSFGSSAYHDPLREPVAFARMLGYNLPVLLSAELFVPVADLAFWGDVQGRVPLWLWSCASLLAIAWLARDVLRRDAHARFWTLGLCLAAVPVSASLPGERLLLALGFGAAPLLARLLIAPLTAASTDPSALQRGLTALLVLLHLVIAPLSLPLRAYALEPLGRAIDRLDADLPRTAALAQQTVVILNAPFNAMLSYLSVARAVKNQPRPAHLYWLASASSELRVTRTGPRSLEVSGQHGFLRRPEETHYRADLSGLAKDARVELTGMQVRIAASLPDGRPARVEFEFADSLESPRYLFRVYQQGRLVPLTLKPHDEGLLLPQQDLFNVVLAEALR
jgi:hypothetical protein